MARILVVDDDAKNLTLAVTVLEQAGHEVLGARGDAERLLAEGFDGYLEKPIRYQAFLARVAALLAPGRAA